MVELKPVGEVVHFYKNISVAVIRLTATLEVGEVVRFERGGEEIGTQEISSMELDHTPVQSANRGQEVGIRAEYRLRPNAKIEKFVKK